MIPLGKQIRVALLELQAKLVNNNIVNFPVPVGVVDILNQYKFRGIEFLKITTKRKVYS